MKDKLTLSSLLLLALFLTLAPTIMATTWYVDGVKGKDSNPCKAPSKRVFFSFFFRSVGEVFTSYLGMLGC